MEKLQENWEQLNENCKTKTERLDQALQQVDFNRMIEDLNVWCGEAETLLGSSEVIKDLTSVTNLLKRHEFLESDFAGMKDKMEAVRAQSLEFIYAGHFQAENIKQTHAALADRYKALEEPLATRRRKLEESLQLHQLLHDMDDEESWLREKENVAASTDLGKDLLSVQNLQRMHQVLVSEIEGNSQRLDAVYAEVSTMVAKKHPGADRVHARKIELEDHVERVRALLETRAHMLDDAEKCQQFLVDCTVLESTLAEKEQLVSSTELGKTVDATQSLLKKHTAVLSDIETLKDTLAQLETTCERMTGEGHAQAEMMEDRLHGIKSQMEDLQHLAKDREGKLEDMLQLHQFTQDVDNTEAWISEKEVTAASKDVGIDEEDCELLRKRFDDFLADITASEKEWLTPVLQMADTLLNNPSCFASTQIEARRTALENRWHKLLDMADARADMLAVAQDIHKFNREADEVLSRVHEKAMLMVLDDYGKDLAAVQALQRTHEGFERDLAAVEKSVNETIDTAERLAGEYPDNADRLQSRLEELSNHWDDLLKQAAEVKTKLNDAHDLQVFLTDSKHHLTWAQKVLTAIGADPLGTSSESAEQLLLQHKALRGEIDSRAAGEQELVEVGNQLLAQKHYAEVEVQERLGDLADTKRKLGEAWEARLAELQQSYAMHVFLQEVEQANTVMGKQESRLQEEDVGSSVDTVDALLKKHDDIEKSLAAQSEKMKHIEEQAEDMVTAKHYDAANIVKAKNKLLKRRAQLTEAARQRRNKLEASQQYYQLVRDAEEMESWIAEQLQVATDDSHKDSTNLKGKLNKHQAFATEVAARKSQIETINTRGQEMIKNRHHASQEIRRRLNDLSARYDTLNTASQSKGAKLADALKFLEFNLEVEEVESYLEEKSQIISSDDVGQDLEDVIILQKKFDEFKTELATDEARVQTVNAKADGLLEQRHRENLAIRTRKKELSARWLKLKSLTTERQKKLEVALEIQKFYREVDETKLRIAEKETTVASTDYGKNLASVEALQRKHEGLERDFAALNDKMTELNRECRRLMRLHRKHAEHLKKVQTELDARWQAIHAAAQARKQKLRDAHDFQMFLGKHRDLLSWITDMQKVISADELATNVSAAEVLIKRHAENKSEIDARQGNFADVQRVGNKMVTKKHYATEDIEAKIAQLMKERESLLSLWEERKVLFDQCHDLQLFLRDAEQIEAWIVTQEASLAVEELGNSLDAVQALIKKHDDFDKSIAAQEEKTAALTDLASRMAQEDHYDKDHVAERHKSVLEQRERLLEESAARKQKLLDSQALQQFFRDATETMTWIEEKLQTATEQSYLEPSNLQRKVQRHQAFEAELTANTDRIDTIRTTGSSLISNEHYAAEDIQDILDSLEENWKELLSETEDKQQKLKEANLEHQFARRVEDINSWCEEVEIALQAEELGQDLTSVKSLLKKHQLMENDVTAHKDRVDQISSLAEEYIEQGNFKADNIRAMEEKLVARYLALEEPKEARRRELEASLALQEFFREVQEEKTWIKEREPVAASDELGKDLTGVQSLQKKHQAFESELQGHEGRIDAVLQTGQKLIDSSHYASADIMVARDELVELWQTLNDECAKRRDLLEASLQSQDYYTHANEAEGWMKEKLPLVTNEDYGENEDHAFASSKKHEAVKSDIDAYQGIVQGLQDESETLVSQNHFDIAAIKSRQETITALYQQLLNHALERQAKLEESVQLHQFNREHQELESWLAEKKAIVASDDVGKNKEDVEVLVKKQDVFAKELSANADRITALDSLAQSFIAANHSQSEHFRASMEKTLAEWDELTNRCEERTVELANAAEIHAFNRDVDEAAAWMQTKELSVTEDYGSDLASVEDLQRKHDVFVRDLAAVEDKVNHIAAESARLSSNQPAQAEHVKARQEEIDKNWEHLRDISDHRTAKLAASNDLQHFSNTARDLQSWMADMTHLMTQDPLSNDVAGCEAQHVRHMEHKAEIDARDVSFEEFETFADRLVSQEHYAKEELASTRACVCKQREELLSLWETKRTEIEHCLDMLVFMRDAEQACGWMSFRDQNALDMEHFGDSLDEVEAMLKKHDDFEKTLAAQEEKFKILQKPTKFELMEKAKKEEEERLKREEDERRQAEEEERKRKAEEDRQKRLEEARRKKEEEEQRRKEEEEKRKREEQEKKQKEEEERRKKEAEQEEKRRQAQLLEQKKKQEEEEARRKREEAQKQELEAKLRAEREKKEAEKKELERKDANPSAQPKKKSWVDDSANNSLQPPSDVRDRSVSMSISKAAPLSNLPPIVYEAQITRKTVKTSGGKSSSFGRSWKSLYMTLRGSFLYFFPNAKEAAAKPETPQSSLHLESCRCEVATDYKKPRVFRLVCPDSAEYLIQTASDVDLQQFVAGIRAASGLDAGPKLPARSTTIAEVHPESPVLQHKDLKQKKSRFGFMKK
eukprot:m.138309 g.138309  ORF g.138309 m.138309 type:complete len:2442 (+) comp24033_c0_seq6:296-7621(+)